MEIVSFEECCGCEACVNICPRNCVCMVENEEGFMIPQINEKECVSCEMCKRVCPVLIRK